MENAYVAGLFDGEGCVGIYPSGQRSNTLVLHVSIANTYLPVLEKLVCQFGGSVHLTKPKVREGTRQVWQWQVRTDRAHYFLLQIYPYLVIKQEQVLVAFDFIKTRPGDGKLHDPSRIALRKVLATKIKDLKRVEFVDGRRQAEIDADTLLEGLMQK